MFTPYLIVIAVIASILLMGFFIIPMFSNSNVDKGVKQSYMNGQRGKY